MDFSRLKENMEIKYIGDSLAYGGVYTLYSTESTYVNKEDCPEHERGKLMIIELINDDTPVFFTLDMLNPDEWELYNEGELQMIDVNCISCENKFGIPVNGKLEDYEGCTLDCPDCMTTFIIEDGVLKDFNEVLKQSYKEMGLNIDEDHDYTKDYIDV